MKISAREGCRVGQKMSITLVFANWTVPALEETSLSLCRSSRAIIFRFNNKTQWLRCFVTLRPPCLCPSEGRRHGVPIQSFKNLGDTLLQITREEKQQRPDSWRGCLYINHLSYPRFLTLFIEWLRFLVLIKWLVKTENIFLPRWLHEETLYR